MACNCAKNRTVAGGGGRSATSATDTFRVMVGTRKVYETTNDTAAKKVGGRFDNAVIHTPGGKTLVLVVSASGRTWVEQ